MRDIYHAAGTGAGLVVVCLHPSEQSHMRAALERECFILILEHYDTFGSSPDRGLDILIPIQCKLRHKYPPCDF